MLLVFWWIKIENRYWTIDTSSILRGGISVTEKVVLKIKLTIVEHWRDRNIGIYIWPTFSHVEETSCPGTKQSHLGKCSHGKSRASTLFNYRILRSTTDFASALGSANNVEISDLLEFLVMLLFSSLCSHPKIICGGVGHF